ncbi:MAG: ACP S-malonyltransferase [Nanoarchaeota archaeon]|nr:ACP S-malonyltransferase [Nanoarchaeota archaeon]
MAKLKIYVGQATQYVGMYKNVLGDDPEINKGINKIYSIGEDVTSMPLRDLSDKATPEEQQDTAIQQPLILANTAAIGYSTGDVIRIEGNEFLGHGQNNPDDIRIGFSLGELYSLVAAGMIPLTSAFRIALKRGELMSQAGEGTTLAAVVGPEEVEYQKQLISFDDYLSIITQETGLDISLSIFNSPGNRTVGGPIKDVRNFKEYLEEQGLVKKVVSLEKSVSGAFHTKHFKEAGEKLKELILAEGKSFYPLHQEVLANFDTLPYNNSLEERARKYSCQVCFPVKFQQILEKTLRSRIIDGIQVIGPKAKILTKSIQKTVQSTYKVTASGVKKTASGVQKTAAQVMEFNRNVDVVAIDTWKAVKRFIDEQKELKKLRPAHGLGFP